MARGQRKHLKRIRAPKHWFLGKLGGNFAPKTSPGPAGMKHGIPVILLLREKLRYAMNYRECRKIMMGRRVRINGRIRTDIKFPLGLMDVVGIEGTKQFFRIVLDTKGRYRPLSITEEESKTKLVRVNKIMYGPKHIPTAYTSDGRTLRFLHPEIKKLDTIRIDLETGKIVEHLPMTIGALILATSGKACGRIGQLVHIDRFFGGKDIIQLKDAKGHTFSTILDNGFVIGDGAQSPNKPFQPAIKWLREKGIKKSVIEEHQERYKQHH